MSRGEISSTQVVIIVIALVGFLILLGFLRLAFGDSNQLSERETCRLSVLTRATAPTQAQSSIPLKCTTSKICLTSTGGSDSCPEFAGQSGVSVIKISGDDDAQAHAIEKISADALYDCWNMMGQGKLDLFGLAFQDFRVKESRCVICSRVALSENIGGEVRSKIDLNRYMRESLVPGTSLTYLETFADGLQSQTFTGVDQQTYLSQVDSLSSENKNDLLKTPQSNQLAFVFAQRKSPSGFGEGFLSGVEDASYAVIGTTLLVPGAKSQVFNPTAWLGAAAFVGGAGTWAGVSSWWDQSISAGYCGKFSSSVNKEEDRKGCSLVRAMPYSVESINQICQNLEGDL